MARRVTKAGPRTRRLDADTLDFMFPCHFEIDRTLRIVSPGPGLPRLVPEALPGALLKDVFRFESPLEPSSPEDMALLGRNQVVLAMRSDERLKLRGVVAPQPDGATLFLLSPVIADGSAAADLRIDFNSLSPCDGSAELLIATEMQRLMTAEAKELAQRLGAARDRAVERQAFFDTILQLLPAMVMVKDAKDGRYLLVNATAEDVLGISAEEMLGRSVFDLFPRKEAVKFTDEDAQVIASGEMKVEQEEAITTRTRGQRYFITKKLATYGEEGARYVVTVGEDVTERHEAEAALRKALKAAEEASLSKSTFLANMSHEIRTPLNGIVAIADILSRAELPAKAQDLIQIIQASGETLERLLSDILDLARVESHQITIEVAPFHLGELARATAALARLRADEKGVQVEVRLDAQVDRVMAGDMVRVRQILTNLLSNAVKFTAAGRVLLTISRTEAESVRFVVEDTGVGFDQDAKARVFGRFQQADDTITRRFGGSGLGLAISRELVELMGGVLDCDSVPGAGSTFWFEIPLEPGEAVDARQAPRGASVQSANLPRVLVADDHPTNRKVVELMLEGHAQVVSVENGEEAISAFRSGAFDLVLMDMQMPVMDGLTAVREIRRCEDAAAHLPIIMLTANALPEHVAASLAAGADLHLDKPITAASLFAAIDEATVRSAAFGAPDASAEVRG
jgi:PAS domain S-box-containing protein